MAFCNHQINFILASFLFSISIAIATTSFSVHEPLAHPEPWTKRSESEPQTSMNIKIALKQSNLDKADEYIMNVSDPDSPHYSDYWTVDQVYSTFAPPKAAVFAFKRWLGSEGINAERIALSESSGWISFDSPVEEAQRLFHTLKEHLNHSEGYTNINTKRNSIPDSVISHIDFVEAGDVLSPHCGNGALYFNAKEDKYPNFTKCARGNLTCCSEAVHPGCIRALYDLPEVKAHPPAAHQNNTLGLFEPGGKDTQKDLNKFFKNYAPRIPAGTYPDLIYGDDKKKATKSLEAALDLDLAYPIVYPEKIESYEFSDFPHRLITRKRPPPNVIATTWSNGFEPNPTSPSAKRYRRQCYEYMKLALLGTSVFASAGDAGTGCYVKDSNRVFAPDFPAACPYLTSVGATEIANKSTVYDPEIAANLYNDASLNFTSGGGFSVIFPAPAYQSAALKNYFSDFDPRIPYYNGSKEFERRSPYKYNRQGRGFPDVSAVGVNITIVFENEFQLSFGTSASAPIWAAVVNRIVGERLKVGKRGLGFLNPALYQHPEILNDVIKGFNSGCGYQEAFHAVEGWDPVTGLGTPNYPKMLRYFMSLK